MIFDFYDFGDFSEELFIGLVWFMDFSGLELFEI
jgi:hypothetical protein